VRLILGDAGKGFGDVGVFVHGTTLATNAVIERRGARTALIATEGFRDVLDIANESRYDQYDLSIEKPRPLVARAMRFTIPERLDVHGKVRLALDEGAVRTLAGRLKAEGIESVAVAFMHSYVNPAHERRVREILKAELPDLWVTLSSEVCPEVREYERTSTAVANAYVQPLMDSYLARMQTALAAEKFTGTIYLVTSGGGLTAIETARRFPVRLVESGPAGGAIFAAQVAARAGESRALSYDMGGTTAKICLIDDYQPHTARLFEVDRAARFLKGSGLPVRIPVIEMVEIGAGGGSIARLDALKRVTVGPESAGAEPGPACYGRGGRHPAVTDANVVLGTIDPAHFAGGSIALDIDAARGAIERDVAEAHKRSLAESGAAEDLVHSGNLAEGIEVYAQKGDWTKCLEVAQHQGSHMLIKYATLHGAALIQQGAFTTAAQIFSKYGTAVQNVAMYRRLAKEILATGDYDGGEVDTKSTRSLKALREMLQKVVHGLKTKGDQQLTEEFERLLWIAHLTSAKDTAEERGSTEVRRNLAISLLRYIRILAADKAFYDAGQCCRSANDLSMAFVFLNRYLDITEAMEENQASSTTLDNSDFADTEIPFDFPLPDKQFLSDADREKVRDYVLQLSMNEKVKQQLNHGELDVVFKEMDTVRDAINRGGARAGAGSDLYMIVRDTINQTPQ
jgi:N-methylhydantoinase A/oxoprolinase/acetone carboxylase beta subunit